MDPFDARLFAAEDAYALGLWCADGYHRSSSIGLSNIDPALIVRFASYLVDLLGQERLRLRIYEVPGQQHHSAVVALTSQISICPAAKMKHTAYHVYVNSRPLLRTFRLRRRSISELPLEVIAPYFAGRFDGDGSLGTKRVPGTKIAYASRQEAEADACLLAKAGFDDVSVHDYRAAHETCLYMKSGANRQFLEFISEHSCRLSAARI